MKNLNKSKLVTKNSKFIGGFSSLNEEQITKIKGGQKDAMDSNDSCLNGTCSGSSNGDCTNKIQC